MQLRQPNEPDRIRRYTTREQQRRIDDKMAEDLRYYGLQSPGVIDERIRQLRCEWSIERYLQLNVAAVGLTTALLAVTRDRRWGYVTCAGLAFFLLHAVEGFDPPLPLLRQFGIRSRNEINREIYALKVIRGDFDDVESMAQNPDPANVERALRAVGV